MQLPVGPRFPDGLPISHKLFLVGSRYKQVGRPPSFKCTTATCGDWGFWPFNEISGRSLLRRSAVPAVG